MKIAILTCLDLPEPDHDEELLLQALASAGHTPRMVAWDDPDSKFDAKEKVIIRSTWNYHLRANDFLQVLSKIDKTTTLINPFEMVRWNLDKRYLFDRAKQPLNYIPTIWLDQGERISSKTLNTFGSSQIILKPTVSAGSYLTQVFPREDITGMNSFLELIHAHGSAMMQPFFQSVTTLGERSVICVAGKPLHTIVKRPRFEGQDESVGQAQSPSKEDIRLASIALSVWSPAPTYARVDLILDPEGNWVLSELELIEPSLFFAQCPSSLTAFVSAITAVPLNE